MDKWFVVHIDFITFLRENCSLLERKIVDIALEMVSFRESSKDERGDSIYEFSISQVNIAEKLGRKTMGTGFYKCAKTSDISKALHHLVQLGILRKRMVFRGREAPPFTIYRLVPLRKNTKGIFEVSINHA